MESVDGGLLLSAADLIGHLACRHLTALDKAVAAGTLEKSKVRDPLLEVLRERGATHERNYVEHLRSSGFRVVAIEGVGIGNRAVQDTLAAMRAGVEVIVQASLRDIPWGGRIDILRRIEAPSRLGPWSYEVVDTKLARETKGGTVLQLCFYSELVANAQGIVPDRMYVVSPWTEFEPEVFRTTDYLAYYRLVKASLQASVADVDAAPVYPDPKEHCDICRWRLQCAARRRQDDHLCLVAGATRLQIDELKRRDIDTAAVT